MGRGSTGYEGVVNHTDVNQCNIQLEHGQPDTSPHIAWLDVKEKRVEQHSERARCTGSQ